MTRIRPLTAPIDTGPDTPSGEGAAGSAPLRRSRRLKRLDPEPDPREPAARSHAPSSAQHRRTASVPTPAPAAWPQADTPITRGYRRAPMPTDPGQLRAIHVNARLADYVYTRDPGTLPGDWAPSTDLAQRLCIALDLPAQTHVGRPFGTLVDERSGLVATVLVSPQAREVVLAFGGSTAGSVAGSGVQRVFGNFAITMTQWKANAEAALGGLPASYEQAATALRTLGGVVGQGEWAGYTLRTVGHSKGAGEAAYAALAQPVPLKADLFSPAHLSHGLVERLPFTNVIHAVELVKAYSVETDVVPALRDIPRGTIDGVGTEHTIPLDLGTGTSMINVHERFVRHLERYMQRCEQDAGDPTAGP